MTVYNVHIYREMRLFFPGIEAVTPDDRFLIGRTGLDGLLVAAGDGGTGYVRAPLIGRAIADLLVKNNIAADDVQVFLMHQANRNLLAKIAKELKVPEDRFFTNIASFGNTSSASLLIAAAQWSDAASVTGPIVFAAFGAGLQWGALLAVPVAS